MKIQGEGAKVCGINTVIPQIGGGLQLFNFNMELCIIPNPWL